MTADPQVIRAERHIKIGALIQERFPNHARAHVVGVGVDVHRTDTGRFRARHGVTRPYLIYVGRLEPGKGVVRDGKTYCSRTCAYECTATTCVCVHEKCGPRNDQ